MIKITLFFKRKLTTIITVLVMFLVPFTVSAEVVRCKFYFDNSDQVRREFTINFPDANESRRIYMVHDYSGKLLDNDYISGPPHEFSIATVLDNKEHKGILKHANIFSEVIWFLPANGNKSSKIMWARQSWDGFGISTEIKEGDAEWTIGFGEVFKGTCSGFKSR